MPENNRSQGNPNLKRRGFFGAVAAGAAGTAIAATPSHAQGVVAQPTVSPPSAAAMQSETAPPPAEAKLVGRSGSDYMVDVLKSLPLDYMTTMPGSTFRGLHESVINYGQNKKPELLTCLHEEIAVGMAHGYAKVTGKPMACLLHGVVGLQHASMAIYNAWADRVPVVLLVGNTLAMEERRPGVEWNHSAQDNAAMVRDYIKWDDMPASLPHFGQSLVRAYRIAVTPPMAPTLIVADGELQEKASEETIAIPRLSLATSPVGDPNAVMQAAKMLVAAMNPVIIVDRLVSTADGLRDMVELAEALQAPVIDKAGRMNFPTRHPLNHTRNAAALIHEADVVLGLEVVDLFGAVNSYRDRIVRDSRPLMKADAKLISISAAELLSRSNIQNAQRYQPVDLMITGDGEATLPMLVEAVKRSMPAGEPFSARGDKLRASFKIARARNLEAATLAWDASPISVARLAAVLGDVIKNEDWALCSASNFQSDWPLRLWDFNKHYHHIGGAGGAGVGYTGPSTIGAALAHRDAGRIAVSIMGDGELMCAPGSLWTAAHHKIPVLMVMHNNRAYHQELMHVQRMADRHGRGIDRAHIGTTIDNPNIDFAKLADSMGVWSKGPITDPADLKPALIQALAMVKQGQPALVDVVCQPR